jgi:hypothetical protein
MLSQMVLFVDLRNTFRHADLNTCNFGWRLTGALKKVFAISTFPVIVYMYKCLRKVNVSTCNLHVPSRCSKACT